jgi:hypothetical protein
MHPISGVEDSMPPYPAPQCLGVNICESALSWEKCGACRLGREGAASKCGAWG